MSTSQNDQTIQSETDQTTQNTQATLRKPLRLWPGLIAGALLLVAWFIVPTIIPPAAFYGMMVGLVAVLGVAVWWLLLSRARWYERLGAVVLIVIALFVTYRLVHISISNGAMGFLIYVLAVPMICLALVAWALVVQRLSATRPLSYQFRGALLALAILLVCGSLTVIRTGGLSAEADLDLHFRWTKTPEELLLAQGDEPTSLAAVPGAPVTATGTNWPGFRGGERDGVVHGVRIETDWSKSPPVELWRRPIGPAWSSFAVSGDRFYTQEQRGANEVVTCYDVTTGKPVWRHTDPVRFWESNAGPGPRGTPTLSNGRLYSLGATGVLNALDATNGAVVWSRNAASDTKAKLPGWGFSSSPLVVGDIVVVATAGKLAAYDIATGNPRWYGPDGGSGYSSPHLVTINGVQQILLLSGTGATSVAPDGKQLWQHPLPEGPRIVQPGVTAEGDVLTHDGESSYMRRISVMQGPGGWTATERWNSVGLNPYFSDFVVHKGHAYGFSGSSIACIDLKDGELKWKGGRYGHGQLVLVSDQDLLLVLSEQGEIALVKAGTDQFTELARVPAIKGKTWNHPVLAGDILLVRNDQEMAAFRLTRASN